jgi:hypothetical protein
MAPEAILGRQGLAEVGTVVVEPLIRSHDHEEYW